MGWLDSRAQYDRRGWGKVVVGVVGPFDRHAAKRLSRYYKVNKCKEVESTQIIMKSLQSFIHCLL